MVETRAIILAAGKSTRMKSEMPKVLHDVCGRPMLSYVIDACRGAGIKELLIVVGHAREQVMAAFADEPGLAWVHQAEQLGTGHAALVCREKLQGFQGNVLVLYGDGPCIKVSTLELLLKRHEETQAAATLLTTIWENPPAWGRIVRSESGALRGIVELKDCTPAQAAINEVNPGYYCFRCPDLLWALGQINNRNAKNEYYLTDTIGALVADGRRVEGVPGASPDEVAAVNSRAELAEVTQVLHRRIIAALLDSGVTVVDPATTYIDARATIGQDTIVRPFTVIEGRVTVGRRCRIGPFAHLTDGATVQDGGAVEAFRQIGRARGRSGKE
jgi:bifunctional UDP-N-acetylglucosamine pyrophosphorylase / glucosamine-1-phosphate N-acetyltransferase